MSNFFDQFDDTKVSPKTQQSRDNEALRILKAEREKKMTDSDRDALEREIKRTSKAAGVPYEPPTAPAPAQILIPVDTSVKAPPAKDTRYIDAFTSGVNKGYTYGYSPEIAAATGGQGTYESRLKALKGKQAELENQHPIVSGTGEVLGTLLNPLSYVPGMAAARVMGGTRAAIVAGNAANQATIAAAQGYSKNRDPGEAAVGGTLGFLFSVTGDAGAQILHKMGDKGARELIYNRIEDLLKNKPPGWDKTLRKVFNASDDVPEEKLIKHASDYAYGVKNEKASIVEPSPIVHISKEETKAKQEAQRLANEAALDERRAAAKKAYEERTGSKVESTNKPAAPAEPVAPVKTPKEVMDEQDGASFLYLSDPAKYDQLRRERMYKDIEKLSRAEINDVKVMDDLARKHGFDDHIDWARFNQGIEKQEPLSAEQVDKIGKLGGTQGPEGTMGMVDNSGTVYGSAKTNEESIDNLFKNLAKQPYEKMLEQARVPGANIQEIAKKGQWTIPELRQEGLIRRLADNQTTGTYDRDYAALKQLSTHDLVQVESYLNNQGGSIPEAIKQVSARNKQIQRLPAEDRADWEKAKEQLNTHGLQPVIPSGPPKSAPPNTMAMASMPIEQRIEPTFDPDEVVAAAQNVPKSTGGSAFEQMQQTVTGSPPQSPLSKPVTGQSVVDTLAPDLTKDAWKAGIKAVVGTGTGLAIHHNMPEEWKKYSWMLPIIGGGIGARSVPRLAEEAVTNMAIRRAGLPQGQQPLSLAPASITATNVGTQFIPTDAPPDESNYFNQFDAPPAKTGLPGLIDRFKSQWTPTTGE